MRSSGTASRRMPTRPDAAGAWRDGSAGKRLFKPGRLCLGWPDQTATGLSMFRAIRIFVVAAVIYLVAGFVFRMVFAVPEAAARVDATAIPASEETTLGAVVLPLARANPGTSGVSRLADGTAAFAARLQLADAAEASIDVRYYIWQKDITGLLLLDAMRRAADRGVRVRLLLDDNGVPDIGPELAELSAHPNVDLRLFNPFVLRSPRILTYVLDFARVNRRMHNKSFTVDGVASVVGGRNIGDIYFSRDPDVNYFDMDVVALGRASRDVSADFDRYWASPSAVPAGLILPARPADGGVLAASLAAAQSAPGSREFETAARRLPLLAQLLDNARAFEWVDMQLVSDDPAKGQGRVPDNTLMAARLLAILPEVRHEVMLVSAYFVPGTWLTGVLSDWARAGRDVRVLTNAQEATDVLPVHAGYRRYRGELVRAGVQVYELKARQERPGLARQFDLIGSTNSSLHAKTFVIDRSSIFVGSFNFDPRSAMLNTEMGFLIASPKLSGDMARAFDTRMKGRAYLVESGPRGGLRWHDLSEGGDDIVHATEPGTTALSRGVVRVLGWFPIEWLL